MLSARLNKPRFRLTCGSTGQWRKS